MRPKKHWIQTDEHYSNIWHTLGTDSIVDSFGLEFFLILRIIREQISKKQITEEINSY